jgi:uncharacterized membrane protein
MGAGQTFKPRPRIEAFSDLIFGLALSIGALTLIGQQLTSFEALMIALGLYSFSFLILVGVWLSYSNLTSVLPSETGTLTSIAGLFLISTLPFFASAYILPLRGYVWILALILGSGRRIFGQVGKRSKNKS